MLEQLKHARRAAVPIIVIRTPDMASTIAEIGLEYAKARQGREPVNMVQWDLNRGCIAAELPSAPLGADEALKKSIQSMVAAAKRSEELVNQPGEDEERKSPAVVSANPIEAMQRALQFLPADSILCMMNMHILLESRDENRLSIVQGVWNMRDKFKRSKRTLILLVPDLKVPPELTNDVIVLDVALPNEGELSAIINNQYKAANLQFPDSETLRRATEATIGLSQFTAEQVVAMSLREDKPIDLPALWERKKSIIEQNGGLTVHQSGVSFDDIGGLDQLKLFLRQLIKGKRRPRLVVLMDELEKAMGGIGGDTSGVSTDQLGVLLSAIQDNDWSGMLYPGIPGTGKTEMANAMGNEAGGLFLKLDLGGLKDKFVGNSEKLVRDAMRTLKAMGGRNVFFIATTNSIEAIKPELKRRFRHGNYFFDLPSKKEQGPIWSVWKKKFQIEDDQESIDYSNWNGSDIKNVCEFADEMGVSLKEAKNMISPVYLTMGTQIDRLRASAHNRYLSPSYAGLYKKPKTAALGGEEAKTVGSN